MKQLEDRLASLIKQLADDDGSNTRWTQLLKANISRTKMELAYTCCGLPLKTVGMDVHCTVCKRTSR